jgi:CarD family transcriptional regulator
VLHLGQKVVYGIHGVCAILDTEIRVINRKKVEYYVLEPVEQPGARFYVPIQNEAAVNKLRPLVTKEELDALICSDDACVDCWIPDENQRKQRYRDLISSGDRCALIAMVRTLHVQKELQTAAGRKFHLCDENFLRDAEKLLSSEFSLVLGIQPGEVGAYIQKVSEK